MAKLLEKLEARGSNAILKSNWGRSHIYGNAPDWFVQHAIADNERVIAGQRRRFINGGEIRD